MEGDPVIEITTTTNEEPENEKSTDDGDGVDIISMKWWNTLNSFFKEEALKKKEEVENPTPIHLINPKVLKYISPFPSSIPISTTSASKRKNEKIKPSSSPPPPLRKRIKKNDNINPTGNSSRAIHLTRPRPVKIDKNCITFYSPEVEDQARKEESKKYIKSSVLPFSVYQMIQNDKNIKKLFNSKEITISHMIPITRENQVDDDSDDEDEIGDLIIDEDQDSIFSSTNSSTSSSPVGPPVEFDLLEYSALLLEMTKKATKELHQEDRDNTDWGLALSKNGYFNECLSQINSQSLMPPPPPPPSLLKYGYPNTNTSSSSPLLPLPTLSKHTKVQMSSIKNFNYNIDLKIKNAFQQEEEMEQNESFSICSNGYDYDDGVGYLDLSLKDKKITENGRIHANETNDFDFNDDKTKVQDKKEKSIDNEFDPNRFLELTYEGNEPELAEIELGTRNNLPNVELHCTYCSKFFTRSADLRRHLSVHTGIKPFKCDYQDCPGNFDKKSLLIEHKRICHTNASTLTAPTTPNEKSFFPKLTRNENAAEIPQMPTLGEMKSFFTSCS